jgi:hypothetical protein
MAAGTESLNAVRFAVDNTDALFRQIQGIHGQTRCTMSAPVDRLSIAALALTVGGLFLRAAAVFNFLAASHLAMVLKVTLDPKAYPLFGPVVAFTFQLGGVLLLPLSLSTLYSAGGLRGRELGMVDKSR